MEFVTGLFELRSSELDAIVGLARDRGFPVYVLTTGGGGGRDAFFDAVRASLPLDPPLQSNNSWDALDDSLLAGIDGLEARQVFIVWPDSAAYRAADPESFEVASHILRYAAEYLSRPDAAGRPTKQVSVFIARD